MAERLTLTLKTLTPVWTGGVDGAMDRIHETGIVGSLRWWYEAIVRGLGGRACDPGEHTCNLSGENLQHYEKARADGLDWWRALDKAGICDPCKLFGATGWRRRFRLEVKAQAEPAWPGAQPLNIKPFGRTRGWFLPDGWLGTVTLILGGDSDALDRVTALVRFLQIWGSLGSRPQLGYGVFHTVEGDRPFPTVEWEPLGDSAIGSLPDLRSFTFFKLRFDPTERDWWTWVSGLRELRGQRDRWQNLERLAVQGMVPVIPALKNYLRFEQRWSSVALPHWLFGTLRGDERVRSKVALSWAFRLADGKTWEIRGWVHLPNDAKGRAARAEVTAVLRRALENPQGWWRALGLQTAFRYPAQVIFAPTVSPWQMCNSREIAMFLNRIQLEATR